MAAIFGPGGPIILPWTVRGDRFSGGTVHGVTGLHVCSSASLRMVFEGFFCPSMQVADA